MDWRLAMRSAQLSTVATAAALFQRDLVMRKAECLTGETRGLALQRPHPDVKFSWLVVQRATASRIEMVSLLAIARALRLVTATALAFVLASVKALVSMLVWPLASLLVLMSPLALVFLLLSVWALVLKSALVPVLISESGSAVALAVA